MCFRRIEELVSDTGYRTCWTVLSDELRILRLLRSQEEQGLGQGAYCIY
jgi:hypothetical protein